MSRFEGGPHSLKANPSAGTDDQNSRHARQCSCRTRHSFVMCDLGSRIARWMGGLNTAAEARIGPDTRGVDPDVRFWPKADIPSCTAPVRFRGQSRHELLRMSAFAVAIGGKADMTFCNAHVCF